jgi:tetraacyldisaccharide 4'-kinase
MNFLKPKFWDNNHISFYSILLLPLSWLILLINKLRSLLIKRNKFSIPVICVGNIYLGGTGKTPISIEIKKILDSLNKKSVFIKKKYKAYGDEINLLKKYGEVLEKNKRVDALKIAVENKYEAAILDDGFQDFSIKKDVSIVCFNSKQFIGNGLTIPSGPLRETLSGLDRANFVLVNGKLDINLEKKILKKNKFIKIFYFKYKPLNLKEFKDKKIFCFAGIGNPANFFELLKKNGVNLSNQLSFPDHHNYSNSEIVNLINKAKESSSILLTTEKDYLRLSTKDKENINCLKIDVEIENKNEFIKEVNKLI